MVDLQMLGIMDHMADREPVVYNRGISGNKVYQLAERWQKDCLDLKPDILSILIGINDYWHMRNGHYDGTLERYEQDYRQMTRDTWKRARQSFDRAYLEFRGTVLAAWRARNANAQAGG